MHFYYREQTRTKRTKGDTDPTRGAKIARLEFPLTSRAVLAHPRIVCYIAMRWCCGASSIEPAEPLTAEQLAEKKKEEAELIAAQLAKPSYWDEVGPNKPNASALKAALADTVLVDAAWLARLADEGGILPRCQDLPPGARVTLEEMEKWKDSSMMRKLVRRDNTLGVLVISYPWWAPPHSTPSIAPPAHPLLRLHVTRALPPLRAQARRRPPRQGRAAAAQDRKGAETLRQAGQGEVRRRLQGGRLPGLRVHAAALAGQPRGRPHARGARHLQALAASAPPPPCRPAAPPASHPPRCLPPFARASIRGLPTIRRMCSSSTPSSPRARTPTCTRTPGVAGA